LLDLEHGSDSDILFNALEICIEYEGCGDNTSNDSKETDTTTRTTEDNYEDDKNKPGDNAEK
jgi:hypothetical protein